MSSGCPVQNIYFSTHNALRNGDDEEEKVWLLVSELEGGPKQVCILVYPFYDIEMVKRLVIKRLNLPKSTNVSEIRIFYKGSELPNHRSLTPFVSERTRSKIRLQWAFRDGTTRIGLRKIGFRPPPFLQSLINEISLGLQRGVNPKLTLDGTGGTYILFNGKRQQIAMFKPQDEEAFAPNNPRGFEGQIGQKGFRSGVVSGEGSCREVAAFLLDAQYGGFARVPQTTQVEACHPSFCYKTRKHLLPNPSNYDGKQSITAADASAVISNEFSPHNDATALWKEGSLQEFVDAKDTCGDFDPRVFPIRDAHYIAIFDLRVLNLDRNDGNILVASRPIVPRGDEKKYPEDYLTPEGKISKYRLIPIDHGLVLPDTMDLGDIDLVWYYWPQSKMPFSETELRYIFSLDSDRDAWKLRRKLDIREECLRTMRVSTRLLQIGAKMHLNLQQIASLAVRKDDLESPSIMERAVKTALIQAYTAVNASSYMQVGRLPGSILLDLHYPEPPLYSTRSDNNVIPVRTAQGVELGSSNHQLRRSAVSRISDSCFSVRADGNATASDCVSHMSSTISNNGTGAQASPAWAPGRDTQLVKQESTSNHMREGFSSVVPLMTPSDALMAANDESSTSWSECSDSDGANSVVDCSRRRTDNADDAARRSEASFVPVSRITGIPLDSMGDSYPSVRPAAHGGEEPPNASSPPRAKTPLPQSTHCEVGLPEGTRPLHGLALPATEPLDDLRFPLDSSGYTSAPRPSGKKKTGMYSEAIGSRAGTASRRRPTALPRTQRGFKTNSKSTWTLLDSNRKVIPLDWGNPILEKTFFECFELLIKHYILEEHPNWHTYPFEGRRVLRELEMVSSTRRHHHHRRRSYYSPQESLAALECNQQQDTTRTATYPSSVKPLPPASTSYTRHNISEAPGG